MDISNQAKASQFHYSFGKKITNKDKKNVKKEFKGYVLDEDSDENVMGIFNKDKNHLHINHRGLSKPIDFVSGYLKLRGLEDYDPQFNSRRKQTKKMILKYPGANVSASGHSMGGGTLLHAIHNSPSLEKHINEINVFNPLSTTKFTKNSNLKDKLKIYKAKHDIVALREQPYKTVVVEPDVTNPLEAHSLDNFIDKDL